MPRYLVDIGKRNPLIVDADNHHAAAYEASIAPPGLPSTLTAVVVKGPDASGETNTTCVLILAHRKCRECGCTEEKACPGGCCWMAWDLCSACVKVAA
jgi:hypothetical protein